MAKAHFALALCAWGDRYSYAYDAEEGEPGLGLAPLLDELASAIWKSGSIIRYLDVRDYLPPVEDPRVDKGKGKGGKKSKKGMTSSGRRPGQSALVNQQKADEVASKFNHKVVERAGVMVTQMIDAGLSRLCLAVNCTAGLHRPGLDFACHGVLFVLV